MKIYIYQNKRNPHKYIEVHNDGYYHNAIRQFMYWDKTEVKNMTGDGFLHRWKKDELSTLLKDYVYNGCMERGIK